MSTSQSRRPKPPPVKTAPIPWGLPTVSRSPTLPAAESIPPLHHFMQKYDRGPTPPPKDPPHTSNGLRSPQPATSESPPSRSMNRVSSVYSHQETSWEMPSCWNIPEDAEDEVTVRESRFILPPTVYKDETLWKLDNRPSSPRSLSPIIPEPSPNLDNFILPHLHKEFHSSPSPQASTPLSHGREWESLPPTPPSPRSDERSPSQLKPPASPILIRNGNGSPLAPQMESRLAATPTSWHTDRSGEDDGYSSHPITDSTDSLPRGRMRQRNLPSYFHREQNYARSSDERAALSPAKYTSHLPDVEQRSMTSDNASSAVSNSTAKSEAFDLLKQRKAKTLSEAYHRLLIDRYQDEAAEGRACTSFADLDSSVASEDAADGRDIRLIPPPLFFAERRPPGQGSTARPYVQTAGGRPRSQSVAVGSSKSKGGLFSLKGVLPSPLRRKDSSTSGDILISPPPDLYEANGSASLRSRGSPVRQKKPRGKKKDNMIAHLPPLPLTLPKVLLKSPRPSMNRTRATNPRSNAPATSATTSHGSPLHNHAYTKEKHTWHMSQTPGASRPMGSAGADSRRPYWEHVAPSSPQTPPDSASSGTTFRSILDKVAGTWHSPETIDRRSGGSAGSGPRWHGKALESLEAAQKAKRQHQLKKSIRFVGPVDPRNVETLEDTTRRLAFVSGQGRRLTFGEGWGQDDT